MLFWIISVFVSLAGVLYITGPVLDDLQGNDGIAVFPGRVRFLCLVLTFVAPVGAFAVYLELGTPGSGTHSGNPYVSGKEQGAQLSLPAGREIRARPPAGSAGTGISFPGPSADDIEGWREQARSFYLSGNIQEGVRAWRMVIAAGGGHTRVSDWYDYIDGLSALDRSGRPVETEMRNAVFRLYEMNADDPVVLYHLALLAQRDSDTQKALSWLKRLRAVLPDDAPVFTYIDALEKEILAGSGSSGKE